MKVKIKYSAEDFDFMFDKHEIKERNQRFLSKSKTIL